MSFKPAVLMLALGLIGAPLHAAEPVATAEIVPAAALLPAAAAAAATAADAQPAAEAAPAARAETPHQKRRRLREELRGKLGPSVYVLN